MILVGSKSGEWGHSNTVLKLDVTNLEGLKQSGGGHGDRNYSKALRIKQWMIGSGLIIRC